MELKLEETVDLMVSDDYKNRFKAEYYQLIYRTQKLSDILSKHYEGTLEFELTCGIELLEKQLEIMDDYVFILEERAQIEGIEL